jgi:hypothetical protein
MGKTLEEAHMKVPAIRRLTVTERRPEMAGRRTDWHWKEVGPRAAAFPQHEKVCRLEALFVQLSLHWKRRSKFPVVYVQKKRDAAKKEANFRTLGSKGTTAVNTDGQTAYLTAENLGVMVTVLAGTGCDYSAVSRSAVEDARKRGFPLKVEVLPKPIMLNMAIRGESDKQKCSATELLMSAVTIFTLSGPL